MQGCAPQVCFGPMSEGTVDALLCHLRRIAATGLVDGCGSEMTLQRLRATLCCSSASNALLAGGEDGDLHGKEVWYATRGEGSV